MTTSWTFADGESASKDAVLGNSPANTLPIRCVVTLNDTGEVVLETGAIPVGAELPDIILEKDLDPGKYDAVCTIYLLTETENGYEEFSNAGFNITITVEN